MNLNRSKEFLYLLIFLIAFFSMVLIALILTTIPSFYDKIKGEEVVDNWIEENIANETDPVVISTIINLWIKDNVHYPSLEEEKKFFFYKIDGKLIFWPRSPRYISWTIHKKLGRCEEDAYLFVGIMDRLGYRARVIKTKGWDHAWAEFYPYNNSYKFVVDPSANQPIPDLKEHGDKADWKEIYAIDLEGNKEDLSEEYS